MEDIINKVLIFGVVPVADSLTYLAQGHVVYILSWLAAAYYIQNIQCTQNEKPLPSADCENCAICEKIANNQKNFILKIILKPL